MKNLNALPVLLALATACSYAMAGSGFTTIRRAETDINDSAPMMLVTFNLPASVTLSPSTANSAVLDMEVGGSEFYFNRAYINPPTQGCTSNKDDANEAAAIGYLQQHSDVFMKNEWATNHITFSSALLKAGANQLMICTRDANGNAGSGVTNLDAISARNVVLQFHANR